MREHLKGMLADRIAALVGDDGELRLMVAERLLAGTERRSSRIVERATPTETGGCIWRPG